MYLALVGVDTGARVPDREPVAAEPADGGAGQGEHRTGPQVDRVLRDVVDVAVREGQDRVGVQGDTVGGRAVHGAVREVRAATCGDLHPAALDLVHLTADRLQAAALPGHAQSRARGVVHAAALEPRVRAVAHRDTGLPGRHDLALLEHAAGAVEYGDSHAGRVVDRAAAHGGPRRAPHFHAGGRPGHDAQIRQLGSAVLDEQRGGGRVLALHMEVLDHGGRADGQGYAVGRCDPYGPGGPFGAPQRHRAVDDEVLPVGAGCDGEHVTVRCGLKGGAEGSVFARTAPPSRCAGVRHLDRALCHGAAVPPPRAVCAASCLSARAAGSPAARRPACRGVGRAGPP